METRGNYEITVLIPEQTITIATAFVGHDLVTNQTQYEAAHTAVMGYYTDEILDKLNGIVSKVTLLEDDNTKETP
jgi:hypothetical protein